MGEEKKTEFEVLFRSENGKLKVESVSENFTVEEFMKQRHITRVKIPKKQFKALDKYFRKEFIKKSKAGEFDLRKIFPGLEEMPEEKKEDVSVNYELKSDVTLEEIKALKEKIKKFFEEPANLKDK
jgi:hypothetical protein